MRWIEESKRLYVAENTLRGSLRIITFPQPNHFLHYAVGSNRITNHPCYRLVEQEQLPAYVRDRTPPPAPSFFFLQKQKGAKQRSWFGSKLQIQYRIPYAVVSSVTNRTNGRVGFSHVVPEGYSDPRQPGSRVRIPWGFASLPCLRHRPALHGARPERILARFLSRGSQPHQLLAPEPPRPWPQPQETRLPTLGSSRWPCRGSHSLLEGGIIKKHIYKHDNVLNYSRGCNYITILDIAANCE